MLIEFLKLLGPVLVSILTVPLMGLIKQGLAFVDRLSPNFQRLVVLILTFFLTQLGLFLNVATPEDITLFAESDLSALLSAALALAIHAGNKAKGK